MPITVEVVRGGVVEARHRVHAVAVSDGARSSRRRGDRELETLFRSSAKPLQALPIVRARPDLDDAEIAIASASHLHRPDQLEPVRSLLAKADATEDDLECGPEPTRIEHNCSGKHAGDAAPVSRTGWPIEGYRLASHPCQQELLAEVAAAAEVEAASVPTAVDGCGVVTYGFTLERMAHAFARLERLDGGSRVADAMRARPELVRGDGAPDTELMRLGRLGVEGRGRGAALRRPRRPRHRAQGRGRSAAPARPGARGVSRPARARIGRPRRRSARGTRGARSSGALRVTA